MAFTLFQVGKKYRIKTEDGGFLRQMGPRKLSKDHAEYRLAVLNGDEPFDYPNDETSQAASDAAQASVDNYIASQSATRAKYEASSSASQEIYNSCSESLAELEAGYHADPPTVTQEEYEASSSILLTSMSKAETTMSRCAASMSKCDANIENAANNAPAATITGVPEVLVLDNTPKKGYKVEADFTVNNVTTIEANEAVEGGIVLKNTSEEPANIVINVGNSDVTLYANTQWNEVTVESVADGTLTVATSAHIKKLIIKKGRVWVNNALIEDCIDEVEIKGGKVEANPVVNATKVRDFDSKPAIVKINNDLSTTNYTTGILTSGHYIYENNARVDFTKTGSTSAGYLIRGSKLLAEFKGQGEWHSANNPCIWLSDFDGVVKIHDGKFFNDANSNECIYAEKGFIEIYGGEFHNVKVEGQKDFLLNCLDANYQSGKAGIKVYGGKFYGFDPAANAAESSEMTTNFVAEGYESVYNEEGGYYEVKPVNTEEVLVGEIEGTGEHVNEP